MIASIIQHSHNYPHVLDEVWMNIKPHTKFYVSLSFVLTPNVTTLKHFWCLHFNYLGVIIIGRYGAIIIGYKHGALTLLTPHPLGLDLSLGLICQWHPTVAQLISLTGNTGTLPLKRSELSGFWKMHRDYIYNKFFITKLTTPSLYYETLVNNNMVIKENNACNDSIPK